MSDDTTKGADKGDASKKSGDELITVKIARKHLNMSDDEIDKLAGGRMREGGYGTLDYGTMTSHGGD